MELILEKLLNNTTRQSTEHNYYAIWKTFNTFLLKLDHIPGNWEYRLSLFGAHLVTIGSQSSTIKS